LTAVRLKFFAKMLGWSGVVFIGVLSTVPGQLRPHTSLPSGQWEHLAAYFLTSLCLTAGYYHRVRSLIFLSLSAYAGILEALQTLVPHRNAQWMDFFAGAAGAAGGNVLFLFMVLVLTHRLNDHQLNHVKGGPQKERDPRKSK
jgi:VanZ family protein